MKSKDTGDVVVGNGEYMHSTLTFDGTIIQLTTHTFTHVKLKGFTGGVSFLLVDINGKTINPNGVGGWVTYGVDGQDILWGNSDRWDTQTYTVDPNLYYQTDQIVILQKYSPQNRLVDIINEAIQIGEDIVAFFLKLGQQGPVYNTDSSDPYPADPGDCTFESVADDLVARPAPVLPAPTLIAPADGQEFTAYPRTTTLSWQPVSGANGYQVEVDYGNPGVSGAMAWALDIKQQIPGTKLTFDFAGDQPGRWCVTALDTTGAHQPSQPAAWRTFTYKAAAPVLPAPTLVSPADGQHFTNYPRATTLSWQAVAGANAFQVEVQYGNTLADGSISWAPDVSQQVSGTTFTFNFIGDQPGRWRVTAMDTTGAHQPSLPTAWRTFAYKTAPPLPLAMPVLLGPANGQHFTNYPRTTTLKWQALTGANAYRVEVQYGVAGAAGTTSWISCVDQQVSGTTLTFNFVGDQSGRWRVTALDTTGAHLPSPPTAWWTFDYKTAAGVTLPLPVLVSPIEGQSLSGHPRITTLNWQSVPGATAYQVEVEYGNVGPGGTLIWTSEVSQQVSGTTLTFNFIGDQPGRWRVTAVDITGTHMQSQPTAWRTFDYSAVLAHT